MTTYPFSRDCELNAVLKSIEFAITGAERADLPALAQGLRDVIHDELEPDLKRSR